MLFIKDSYLKEFNAEVLFSENNKIILNQTSFYAKSGGQPGDTGKLILNNKIIIVKDTIYDEKKNIK